jgi:hypothetical protein
MRNNDKIEVVYVYVGYFTWLIVISVAGFYYCCAELLFSQYHKVSCPAFKISNISTHWLASLFPNWTVTSVAVTWSEYLVLFRSFVRNSRVSSVMNHIWFGVRANSTTCNG